MEDCVELVNYNSSTMVIIKQPGSVRHPQGQAITKIEMRLEEAQDLYVQLGKVLFKSKLVLPDTSSSDPAI